MGGLGGRQLQLVRVGGRARSPTHDFGGVGWVGGASTAYPRPTRPRRRWQASITFFMLLPISILSKKNLVFWTKMIQTEKMVSKKVLDAIQVLLY